MDNTDIKLLYNQKKELSIEKDMYIEDLKRVSYDLEQIEKRIETLESEKYFNTYRCMVEKYSPKLCFVSMSNYEGQFNFDSDDEFDIVNGDKLKTKNIFCLTTSNKGDKYHELNYTDFNNIGIGGDEDEMLDDIFQNVKNGCIKCNNDYSMYNFLLINPDSDIDDIFDDIKCKIRNIKEDVDTQLENYLKYTVLIVIDSCFYKFIKDIYNTSSKGKLYNRIIDCISLDEDSTDYGDWDDPVSYNHYMTYYFDIFEKNYS